MQILSKQLIGFLLNLHLSPVCDFETDVISGYVHRALTTQCQTKNWKLLIKETVFKKGSFYRLTIDFLKLPCGIHRKEKKNRQCSLVECHKSRMPEEREGCL